ncbi:hypothetical protein SUGI_0660520 [Cryptomeria japonica]|uniref:F-box protein GID2-like n=1 Tax=Cryptomeria japonica TaxID=3369 RepID=UPI0024146A8C|nr:F-box protein GID2-like [Cryptomeria japonica]GLJ32802.1 hypothetical protein SUGI_0660520 [Cryptomeria japonica]
MGMQKMEKSGTSLVESVDAMQEIFKHLDAQSLGLASCVSRRWHEAAMEDNLWEVICTKRWPASDISIGQLRCVVGAMGGFRRLYVKWLHPLSRHSSPPQCKNGAFVDDNVGWSEDQVRLSMSLFSVEYYLKLGSFRSSPSYELSAILSQSKVESTSRIL